MRWNRMWVLVTALLVSALFGGLVAQEASAQAQTYRVDPTFASSFALQRSFLIGQDIVLGARVTVLNPSGQADRLTATVLSPDPTFGSISDERVVPPDVPPLTEYNFTFIQATFLAGDFTLLITSDVEGVLFSRNFPVSDVDVSVGISTVTGEAGTQFLVTTAIDVGRMSEVQSRFDIEYILDGVPLRESPLVILFGDEIAFFLDGTLLIVPFTQNNDLRTFHAIQAFAPSPGNHTLTVNVVDQSVNLLVASTTFTLQVTDQIGSVETRLDELALELGGRMDELNSRAASAETASATAAAFASLAAVAIVLSIVTLLIQFGILKLGRFRRGSQEPQEPQE